MMRHAPFLLLAVCLGEAHGGEMIERPIVIADALASFTQLWSPRIATRVNDHELRLTKVRGAYVWHHHDDTDEMFLVVEGHLTIEVRDTDGAETAVELPAGSLFTVPRGTEHRPVSAHGASLLLLERSGTLTTGSYDGDIPGHIDSTTGHALA
jgi:mannose-6-phosphate isomerase-like protein (cupin superfamily)